MLKTLMKFRYLHHLCSSYHARAHALFMHNAAPDEISRRLDFCKCTTNYTNDQFKSSMRWLQPTPKLHKVRKSRLKLVLVFGALMHWRRQSPLQLVIRTPVWSRSHRRPLAVRSIDTYLVGNSSCNQGLSWCNCASPCIAYLVPCGLHLDENK